MDGGEGVNGRSEEEEVEEPRVGRDGEKVMGLVDV